jgi:hypothetical protein
VFAAGGPSVSAHRRSLVTATAAGAVLCALWFVPTAKAVPEAPGSAHAASSSGSMSSGGSAGTTGGARQSAPAVPSSAQPDPGSPAVTSAPSAQAAPPPAAAEDGFTSPFALSALGLASAGGFLIVRAYSRTAQAAKPGAGGAGPR